jgi:hypothetical protein
LNPLALWQYIQLWTRIHGGAPDGWARQACQVVDEQLPVLL